MLLATNALFMPFQMGLDLELEIGREMGRCSIAVPQVVLAELQSMKGSVKDGAAAIQYAGRFDTVPTAQRASRCSGHGRRDGSSCGNAEQLDRALEPRIGRETFIHIFINLQGPIQWGYRWSSIIRSG